MNSIPKGYKKTEVGVIPEEWDVEKLGEVCKILRGGSPRPIEDYLTTSPLGINWIKIGDVSSDSKYITDTEEKIIPEGNLFSRRVYPGDFLLSNSMSYGRPYILNIEGCIHDGWLVLQDFCRFFESDFLYYYLSSANIIKQYKTKAAGSSVHNLNKGLVADVVIVIPSLPEQKAIAKVLSDMDALIEAQKELIAKKRDIKQGTMQDLLSGRVRLPGYETKGWKHTDIGDIPDDWKLRKLGETCLCDMNTLSSSTDPNYSFTYISLECVDSGILTNTFEYIFSKAPSRARKIVHQYNVLISTVRPNLKSHYYQSSPCENLICSTGFTVLQTNNNVGKFIFYHFFSNIINKQIETIVSGSNYPSISTQDVASLQIPLPPFSEQKAIAQVLSDMDDEIETLEAELEKLNHMKRGMMQELLTGRIRLI